MRRMSSDVGHGDIVGYVAEPHRSVWVSLCCTKKSPSNSHSLRPAYTVLQASGAEGTEVHSRLSNIMAAR